MKRTQALKKLLGGHQFSAAMLGEIAEMDKKRKGPVLQPCPSQLTLYELGSLIVVAGNETGFDVYCERNLSLGLSKGKGQFGNLDCA